MSERLFFSVKEASEVIGVSVATIWRRIEDGTLPTVKFGQRRLVLKSAIDDLVNSSSHNKAKDK